MLCYLGRNANWVSGSCRSRCFRKWPWLGSRRNLLRCICCRILPSLSRMYLRLLFSCYRRLFSSRIAYKIGSQAQNVTQSIHLWSTEFYYFHTYGALAHSLCIYEDIIVYLLRKTLKVKGHHDHQISTQQRHWVMESQSIELCLILGCWNCIGKIENPFFDRKK